VHRDKEVVGVFVRFSLAAHLCWALNILFDLALFSGRDPSIFRFAV
jgi:hypothetical protein